MRRLIPTVLTWFPRSRGPHRREPSRPDPGRVPRHVPEQRWGFARGTPANRDAFRASISCLKGAHLNATHSIYGGVCG